MIFANNISTRLPILLSALAVIITSATFAWLNWANYKSFIDGKNFRKEVLQRESTLHKLMYYDEALSMSAIIALQTGNSSWEGRHNRFADLFEAHLVEVGAVTSSTSAFKVLSKASDNCMRLNSKPSTCPNRRSG